MNTRPQITISLPPILQAYCRFVFGTCPDEKEIHIRKNYDIAKLIHSNVISSDTPVRRPCGLNSITFILSVDKVNHNVMLNHFLYVSPWGEQKILQGIEFKFRQWITSRFDKGYEKGYSQKIIIEAILRGLNTRNSEANFDAIKKIDYRHRRTLEEKRFNELLKECQEFE